MSMCVCVFHSKVYLNEWSVCSAKKNLTRLRFQKLNMKISTLTILNLTDRMCKVIYVSYMH